MILLGLLLVGGALGIVIYNMWDAARAKKASDEIVAALEEEMKDEEPKAAPKYSGYSMSDDGSAQKRVPDMPVKVINGYRYIGEIERPSLKLKLPVMEYWDYERLRVSPCRYSGSYFTDDLVICAHNYAAHFSPIKWMDLGSDVYFITVDKVVYHYVVDNRETVQPTSIAQMVENQNNAAEKDVTARWDLTLFTCNPAGQSGCAVRCRRVTDDGTSGGSQK